MQASQKFRSRGMSGRLLHRPMHEIEAHCMPQFQVLDHQLCYSASSRGTYLSILNSRDKYWTLESSSANGNCTIYNSPSTTSFLPDGSPVSQQESRSFPSELFRSPDSCGSPISGSCIIDDVKDFWNKLRELETDLFDHDSGMIGSTFQNETNIETLEMDIWRRTLEAVPSGDIKHVLITCAKAVSDNDLLMAQWLMDKLRQVVSVSGEPIQRLGAYMLEGLVAKLASSGSSIYQSLRCKEPASAELLSYMNILHEACPYFKFGYMSANGAIAEAMKDENKVHIIDFEIGQGNQWIPLIQAFAARPGGPPHIRITGIDDFASANARGLELTIVGKRLAKLAMSVKVPFEFHTAAMPDCDIQIKNLGVRPGEALAVNFAFMLHRLPDESVSIQNHRDRLLRLVKSLSPKVLTLVEQESNTNTAAFFPRFVETLNHYAAIFESIDETLPRENKERINVEQHCLAKDIVNIIACEGTERVERHELLGKWRSRFRMAGFTPYPLNSLVNSTIKTLLESYSNKYRLEERDGALYLGWMKRDLVASSAWR